jgi:DNA-binding CsgD family transcriptional regulator
VKDASPRGEKLKTKKVSAYCEAVFGGVHVKVIRRGDQPHQLSSARPVSPNSLYYFYEKNTGVSHFHVEAGPDGRFPVEQAAGLLAMHCMVRGQAPADYVVMVQAEHELLEDLNDKAEKLLQAGHSVGSSVKLTRREEEVLGGLMRSLANKEIAATLNLSERTVKFHVSSLLAKFRVRGRMELVREATRHTSGAMPMAVAAPVAVATREARTYSPASRAYRDVPRPAAVLPLAKRQMMA